MTADQKHGKPFHFYPIAKHIFNMNEVPKITDKSHGFQRRPIVLTFNQRFDHGTPQNDPMLLQKLIKEKNGIFLWMLDGLKTVLEVNQLYVPEVVERDTQEFIQSTNPVLQFIDECCIIGVDFKAKPAEMYKEYKKWCEDGKNRPLARNRFYQQIMIHCPSVTRGLDGADRSRVFMGIGLKTTWS